MRAIRGTTADRYAYALGQPSYQARGAFSDLLEDLLERLRSDVREGGDTERLVRAIARVLDARSQAQGNVNPQLIVASLADDLTGAV